MPHVTPEEFARYVARNCTQLALALEFDPDDKTENSRAKNLVIASSMFGYAASLLKSCDIPLERAIEILSEKWPGMQSGN